ncbi:MAG: acyl-CoA thioesterase, partial [Pyrinomonadaceae bacterium]|nr:acyl-CoA thioesterase [Pyrinomonadaceae bacterium]
YKLPAHYEDVLTIKTQLAKIRSRSLRFKYEIHRQADESLIATGETLHLVTDRQKKIRSIPGKYLKLLKSVSAAKD